VGVRRNQEKKAPKLNQKLAMAVVDQVGPPVRADSAVEAMAVHEGMGGDKTLENDKDNGKKGIWTD
jgi:hypothetical protein